MSTTAQGITRPLDRYTRIGELGDALHGVLKKGIAIVVLIIVVLVARMFFSEAIGWLALLWIGVGTCVALITWRRGGIGLPLLPILAIQHFAVYGIPLINGNETLAGYDTTLIDRAGMEVLILLVACSTAWRMGMEFFRPSKPTALTLRVFTGDSNRALNRVGVALITLSAGYELVRLLGLIDEVMAALPSGTSSIAVAIVNAAGRSGYFLVAMFVAGGGASASTRAIFWCVLTAHLILLSSSILLSSVINIVGAVVIGLFWGSGRLPKSFIIVCATSLAFLNMGKFEMRERYWGAEGQIGKHTGIGGFPAFFSEWAGYSLEKFSGGAGEEETSTRAKRQTMLARMDNLQNLLFVSDRVTNGNSPVLMGETYAIIPPLLIPRILWPEKPRTHEGQIRLNVHFGRQLREDSFTTYIAWGLLPEAYGNFGPFWGACLLGVALGLIFAGLENLTVNKPLLSMEGMVTFVLLIGIAASFEMVASVLITSLFQAVLTVIMACAPFVDSTTLVRPEDDEIG